jgi:hypothetical protein
MGEPIEELQKTIGELAADRDYFDRESGNWMERFRVVSEAAIRLSAEVDRLKFERDQAWDAAVEMSVMRNVFMKKLGEVSPEAEKEAWVEINERVNAMNKKAREKRASQEGSPS